MNDPGYSILDVEQSHANIVMTVTACPAIVP